MNKQAEARIERRLRELFSNGMPASALDSKGLQTRGSFLKQRPASPFQALRKRVRVEIADVEGNGGEEEQEEVSCERVIGGDVDGESCERREVTGTTDMTDTDDCDEHPVAEESRGGRESSPEGSGSSSSDGESGEGEDDAEGEDDEERRRAFRQQVEDNRQYRERLLRG